MAAIAVWFGFHVVVRALGQMHLLLPVPEPQSMGVDSEATHREKVDYVVVLRLPANAEIKILLLICFFSRDLHFLITDLTRHTHHSAWHTMHNVICGGAKFLDGYLEVLRAAGAKIRVVQGREDQVVPVECSLNMKMKDPDIELHILPDFDHNTVISSRAEDFARDLERFWASTDEKTIGQIDEREREEITEKVNY